MRTLIILLLLAAPASAAWDLDNLTPSQRASLITMRDRWNAGFRGTPRCNTGSCSWGLDWSSWTRRQPAATGGNRPGPGRRHRTTQAVRRPSSTRSYQKPREVADNDT